MDGEELRQLDPFHVFQMLGYDWHGWRLLKQ